MLFRAWEEGAGRKRPIYPFVRHHAIKVDSTTYLFNAWAKFLHSSSKKSLLSLVDLTDRQNLLNTIGLQVRVSKFQTKLLNGTDSKLHVDGKVVELGADLLLDFLTTGVGTQENIGLHDLALLASVRGLQHKLGELSASCT